MSVVVLGGEWAGIVPFTGLGSSPPTGFENVPLPEMNFMPVTGQFLYHQFLYLKCI